MSTPTKSPGRDAGTQVTTPQTPVHSVRPEPSPTTAQSTLPAGSIQRNITSGSIERALATREAQGWAAPSRDLSALVVSRIRASHGRKPLTAREPAEALVLRARLLPVPALVGGVAAGLGVAAMLAVTVILPLTVGPAGRELIMQTPLASSAGQALGGALGVGRGPASTNPAADAPSHAAVMPEPAIARTVNEPLAEEARRLGDDTRRAADAVLSSLQVAPSEAAPRR